MPSGGNVFEISDIQEDESEALVHAVENVTMLHSLENSSMEFLRTTGICGKTLGNLLKINGGPGWT